MKVMPPAARKAVLTIHIVTSVGWLGAVAAFLVLAITGLTSSDALLVRMAYLAMNLMAWAVILPLSLASLLSGIIQGLGSVWGLFRHYWVTIKLLVTALATVLLLVHLRPVTAMAEMASAAGPGPAGVDAMKLQLVADAGAALVALLVTTVLSVYKPRGLTSYGQRLAENRKAPFSSQ